MAFNHQSKVAVGEQPPLSTAAERQWGNEHTTEYMLYGPRDLMHSIVFSVKGK